MANCFRSTSTLQTRNRKRARRGGGGSLTNFSIPVPSFTCFLQRQNADQMSLSVLTSHTQSKILTLRVTCSAGKGIQMKKKQGMVMEQVYGGGGLWMKYHNKWLEMSDCWWYWLVTGTRSTFFTGLGSSLSLPLHYISLILVLLL